MPEEETIEDFVKNLPDYFRAVRPCFASESSQLLIDFFEWTRAIGPNPILEAVFNIIAPGGKVSLQLGNHLRQPLRNHSQRKKSGQHSGRGSTIMPSSKRWPGKRNLIPVLLSSLGMQ